MGRNASEWYRSSRRSRNRRELDKQVNAIKQSSEPMKYMYTNMKGQEIKVKVK
jgi:hypothetical protein